MGGRSQDLDRPDATKVPDMPDRGMYQQTVPVDVDNIELDRFELPPSYEEAASSAASGSRGANADGSHGRQLRPESPLSRDSSPDADADDALMRSRERAYEREQAHHREQRREQQEQAQQQQEQQQRTSTDSLVDISGYKSTDPMRWQLREQAGHWERYNDQPGCCKSSTGGCCGSTRGGCCFSDRGGCCFSDREGCCFSDRGGCCFSDTTGCCFSNTAGCCFSSGGACCCSHHATKGGDVQLG